VSPKKPFIILSLRTQLHFKIKKFSPCKRPKSPVVSQKGKFFTLLFSHAVGYKHLVAHELPGAGNSHIECIETNVN